VAYQGDNQASAVDGQQQQQQQQQQLLQHQLQQQVASASTDGTNQQLSHKRKRESIDESGADAEDGRAGTEGSTSSRRTSFKQTSPGMPAFMPINTNSPQSAAYAYQPLNVAQQHPPNAMNGSSATDDANAVLAASAMSTMLPTLQFAQTDSKPGDQQHVQIESAGFANMSPQPMEHTEGVGGVQHAHVAAHSTPAQQRPAAPNPKPQVGTEEWHRVRRDNHKEGTRPPFPFDRLPDVLTNPSQSNDAAEKRSTRESTSSPRSCQGAKRTRARSCSARSSTSSSSRRTRPRTSRSGRWRSC